MRTLAAAKQLNALITAIAETIRSGGSAEAATGAKMSECERMLIRLLEAITRARTAYDNNARELSGTTYRELEDAEATLVIRMNEARELLLDRHLIEKQNEDRR